MPKEHYDTLPKGPWDARHRLYSYTQSLFCNLKWLLLSSRLQASCCPRCWSLRSKMRLLQCCEWADTGEDEGRKERTYSTLLSSWHVQGHLFFTATVSLRCLRTFFILNVLLPTGIKMWCTLLWYSNSHCMQSVHLLILNMVFVLILTALCSKVYIYWFF